VRHLSGIKAASLEPLDQVVPTFTLKATAIYLECKDARKYMSVCGDTLEGIFPTKIVPTLERKKKKKEKKIPVYRHSMESNLNLFWEKSGEQNYAGFVKRRIVGSV
jgi:hypothetical protein